MKKIGFKEVDLNIRVNKDETFHLTQFNFGSKFTEFIETKMKNSNIGFYLVSEIKGTLDIESEGSSRKIIKELVSGKRTPRNDNEQKAINLYSAMEYIKNSKPVINKQNIMIIYNILITNVDMENNKLEDNSDFRQSNEEGFVKKFKTPNQKNMREGMSDLIEFINSSLLNDFPIEKALLIQIIFIYFHPFYDFNGRMGRLMTYWFLTLSGHEKISNLLYVALPQNKDKYIKIWDAFRKFKWKDMTTFLNFFGSIIHLGADKLEAVNKISNKHGVNINETERIIMFYLIEHKGFIGVIQLMKQLDLGISKQGIMKSVYSLKQKKLINIKKSSNKLLIQLIEIIQYPIEPIHTRFFKTFMNDRSKENLTMDQIDKVVK